MTEELRCRYGEGEALRRRTHLSLLPFSMSLTSSLMEMSAVTKGASWAGGDTPFLGQCLLPGRGMSLGRQSSP